MTLNPNFGIKFICDPIYGEIRLNWYETLIVDQLLFQRLRRLLQTQGTHFVYPCSTHTRFSHSLGVMHLSGAYGEAIPSIRNDSRTKALLRLSGLLHDVGHGVFSHVYDDTIYPLVYTDEYNQGERLFHDLQKKKILKSGFLAEGLAISYRELNEEIKKQVRVELNGCGFDFNGSSNPRTVFQHLLDEVVGLWDQEGTDSPLFNIVQGPLGADRLDFMLRDSHFSGSPFGRKVDYQRIISHASIELDPRTGHKVLCYSSRIFGSIFSFLASKFLMYNNMAYHKTCRAADAMAADLLRKSAEPLGLVEKTKDLEQFQLLDEHTFFGMVLAVPSLVPLAKELLSRRLLKVIDSAILPTPSLPSHANPELKKLRRNEMKQAAELRKSTIVANFKKQKGDVPIELLVDSPYEMRITHPDELMMVKVYSKKGGLMSFSEASVEAGYEPFIKDEVRMWRIYGSKSLRDQLKHYGLLDGNDGSGAPETRM